MVSPSTSSTQHIRLLNSSEWSAWDAFVVRNPLGTIYHTSQWYIALSNSFPHIKGHFVVLNDSAHHRIVSGLPIYEVRSWLLGNRAVSIPFASHCDPLVYNAAHIHQIFDFLWCQPGWSQYQNPEIRTCRNHCLAQDHMFKRSQPSLHHYLDLTQGSTNIWNRFSTKSIKQCITKAKKENVTIQLGDRRGDVELFYKLYLNTRRRLNLPPMPIAFLKSLADSFGKDAFQVVLAIHSGIPIAGIVLLFHNQQCYYEFAGDLPIAWQVRANQLLLWEAISLALKRGCSTFSFGRTSLDNDGLIQYKRHFGTQEETMYYYYLNPPSSASHSKPAYRLIQFMSRFAPDLVFRWMGSFCYQHLG